MSAEAKLENFNMEEVEGLTDRMKIMLQAIRYISGVPFHVTSGLRPSDSNSEHSLGMGVDISDNDRGEPISSAWRHKVLGACYAVGLTRIGDYDRHIHIGVSTSHPQDVTWWKTSS
jgi:hypothetical protein